MGSRFQCRAIQAGVMLMMSVAASERSSGQVEPDYLERFRQVQEQRKAREAELLQPRGEASAAVANVLEEPLDLDFGEETPLSEVLEFVRDATVSPRFPEGVPIVVDELGLKMVERSLGSTTRLTLEGVPLKTTLRLLLDQIDLIYWLHPDGYLVVTADRGPMTSRFQTLMLFEELRVLRGEVERLKRERDGEEP
ncbi:hypothetical protein AB1L88_04775 [Tautonia sp. JC769]|uniref:hypothetical protein n=1 Tax=Tautonia sp. JC769 TaxID=3232135 RepID=UPI0034575A9E